MKSLDRYIFRQLFTGFVMISLALVCVLWLTQSLRFVEMIVNRGLGIGMFIYFTALLLPNFLTVILPVALFAIITFVYTRLNIDRELPVMRASGMSNWAIAKPALILTACVMMISYGLNLYMVPKSYQLFRELQWELRNSMSHLLLREGAFNELSSKVTVYVRQRTQEGQLLGILVHDETIPERPVTLMAERGALVEVDGSARVIMFEGNRQVVDNNTGKFSMLYFDRYTHEIPIKTQSNIQRQPEARELMVQELLSPQDNPQVNENDWGKHIVEGHQRLLTPFLCLSNALAALMFLTAGQFSRRGQSRRIMLAILGVIFLQVASLGLANVSAKNLQLLPLLYAATLIPIPVSSFFMSWHRKRNPKTMAKELKLATSGQLQGQAGNMFKLAPTLSIYIGRHFLIHFAVLMLVFLGLIYLIDSIELLRRASSKDGVSALVSLQMALLKLPHLGQETFPFAVLFAAMSAFTRLTRSHELVVARAAGVSAWRFMSPAILVAFCLGLFQIMVINPLGSATLGAYEQMESRYFDGRTNLLSLSSNGLWLRQSNADGQSVLHSRFVLQQKDMVDLNSVTIFIYGERDNFSHRIEADRASLEDGFWHLYDVKVHIAEQPTEFHEELWFETDLTLNKIQESFAPPETMSFWALPEFIKTMEKAGFSGKRHKLYWHSLLSTPLLLASMILIAATFTLRHTRKGGTTFVITAGMMSGFILYFFSDISMALALSGNIPVLLAAWAPASICLLLGCAMILHLEDG